MIPNARGSAEFNKVTVAFFSIFHIQDVIDLVYLASL
jgi:hypothetical protein